LLTAAVPPVLQTVVDQSAPLRLVPAKSSLTAGSRLRLPSTPTATLLDAPWLNCAPLWTNCPGALGVLVGTGVFVGVAVGTGVFVGVAVGVFVAVAVGVGVPPLPKKTLTPLTAGERALVPVKLNWYCRYCPAGLAIAPPAPTAW
jgi:hypothetical protein